MILHTQPGDTLATLRAAVRSAPWSVERVLAGAALDQRAFTRDWSERIGLEVIQPLTLEDLTQIEHEVAP